MKTVIEIDNLCKDYMVGFWRPKPQRALNNLSLQVNEGEIFGFLGGNGAGKTTTLKILMTLMFPTSGSAKILGKSIDDLEMRKQIGYLPEAPYFYDYLTAKEFLDYCGKIFGLSNDARNRRINELLKLVDLDFAADRQLRKFSKGMLQRIGIAQALVNDPKIVFMDEPMSGLDPIGRREVREIIRSLREQGKTIFFSTHILSDVEVLCDRVAILRKGDLAGYGKLSELEGSRDATMEISVQGISNENLPHFCAKAQKVVQTASGLQIQIPDQSHIDEILLLVRKYDGKIISINPVKTALEDFFVKEKTSSLTKQALV
ncbi:MAG: ABC transporter ATP-binding protein [Acidobacteria bacterium]|nr:ABC transporter ATP-binding protein [Acidobacteriota bacterium]